MTQNLANMTPVEIDTLLAPIWYEQVVVQARLLNLGGISHQLSRKIAIIKNDGKIQGVTTPKDGIELVESLAHTNKLIEKAQVEMERLFTEAYPYEAEYNRRGGWTRVYLAKSHDGHAHKGTECSTCHHGEYRTEFAWLVQYSGMKESEIVADAGERACTTCYPSAPVNAKGTKMFTPDEEEAQRRREEREAERARKAQEAADKSITTPEGAPLYESKHNESYGKIKNIRTAEIAATDALKDLVFAQQHATDPEWAWMYENGRQTPEKEQMEYARHAWCLIRSIAHKKGQTFEETFQVHEKKAQAKVRKIEREWAKDPRNPNRVK